MRKNDKYILIYNTSDLIKWFIIGFLVSAVLIGSVSFFLGEKKSQRYACDEMCKTFGYVFYDYIKKDHFTTSCLCMKVKITKAEPKPLFEVIKDEILNR